MNNATWVKNAKDKDTFLDVFEKNKGIIIKVARSYTVVHEDREDLISNITLELWKSFDNYRGDAKLSTWIYRVALNTAFNFQRYKRFHMLNESLDQLSEPFCDSYDGTKDSKYDILYELIADLDKWSRALMLLVLDGYSHEEIAAILGISKTNVGTQIGRVKLKMKAILNQKQ
jgi:RNA polymerase sigma-70 factor, ECF subfamily